MASAVMQNGLIPSTLHRVLKMVNAEFIIYLLSIWLFHNILLPLNALNFLKSWLKISFGYYNGSISLFLRSRPHPTGRTRTVMTILMRFQKKKDMSRTSQSIYELSMVSQTHTYMCTSNTKATCINTEVNLQKKTCCCPNPVRFTHTL